MLPKTVMRIKEQRCIRALCIALFSFSFGCMVTINLSPVNRTCKVEDSDREYNIMKNSKLKNPELIILILSAPENLDRRNTIRETWLKLCDKQFENIGYATSETIKYKHYFVIGSLNLNNDQILHLSSEQSQHSDILILPIHDSYKTLSEKVKKSFEWLSEQYDYGLIFKYVLKCDDDSFVNIPKLANEIFELESALTKENLHYSLNFVPDKLNSFITINIQLNDKNTIENLSWYWGYFSGNARIKTSGKWRENNWIACDRYIPYALGGGYILSKDLITFIGKNSNSLREFNSEDISVGLWLSPVDNIIRIHDIRFDTEWTTRGCQNSYIITHNVSPKEMRQMFQYLVNNKVLCAKEIQKRSFYLYDWNSSPSQCCNKIKENF